MPIDPVQILFFIDFIEAKPDRGPYIKLFGLNLLIKVGLPSENFKVVLDHLKGFF